MIKVKLTNAIEYIKGKPNKKSNEVFRYGHAGQQLLHPSPNSVPASKAQKSNRKEFGKINSIVNVLIANPEESKAAEQRMNKLNRKLPASKRFKTVHQILYHEVKAQLAQQSAAKARKQEKEVLLPRGVKLHINPFTDLTAAELYEILKSRFSVFVLEQGIRYLDEDGIDLAATHIALRRKAQVIAYARLYEVPEDNVPKFDARGQLIPQPRIIRAGRMLTTERGKGYARLLMLHLIAEAKRQGAGILRVHAQQQAAPFYRHFRFRALGDPFLEADLPHILMERKLSKK
jgi:ElaA protein